MHHRLRRIETLLNRLVTARRRAVAPRPRRFQTAQDVMDLLQEQVETLRADTQLGSMQKARALGHLADLGRKAIEARNEAARIEMLEAVLKARDEAKP
jgi:hypothetical protein